MKAPFLLIVLSCWFGAQAQQLDGVWKGTLTSGSGGCFPVYYLELQLNTQGQKIGGASYHYSDISNYVKKKYKGAYDAKDRKLSIQEGPVQTFKIPPDCSPCIKNYELYYIRNGNTETLTGEWTGKVNDSTPCVPGRVTLTRVRESAFKEIPEVEVDTGTIRLDFYDNAEIDGDSISLVVDQSTILSHQLLSVKPITTFIRIDLQHTFHEVEMVATNLGRIPPNTALLIVTAGIKRYRLYLTSTEQKSAKVRFVYDTALEQAPLQR